MAEPFASVLPEISNMTISIRTTRTSGVFEIQSMNMFANKSNLVNGTEILNELASLVRDWTRVCANITFDNKCFTHPISEQLWNIAKYRHWFSWTWTNASEGAYTMLEREMWTRISAKE